jgi:hypothetical protein
LNIWWYQILSCLFVSSTLYTSPFNGGGWA